MASPNWYERIESRRRAQMAAWATFLVLFTLAGADRGSALVFCSILVAILGITYGLIWFSIIKLRRIGRGKDRPVIGASLTAESAVGQGAEVGRQLKTIPGRLSTEGPNWRWSAMPTKYGRIPSLSWSWSEILQTNYTPGLRAGLPSYGYLTFRLTSGKQLELCVWDYPRFARDTGPPPSA